MVDVYFEEQEEDKNLTTQYHDYAKAGTLDVLGATFDETMYYNPANALGRLIDQKFLEGTRGRQLSKEEYESSTYFRQGIDVGEDGITEGLATLLAERYDERTRFRTTLQRSRGGFALGAAQFGVALAGSVLDPINIASSFIPPVAMARGAALAAKTGGARFRQGFVDGMIGAAAVEPLVIGAARAEQDQDYALMDSFLNVALGGALGGGLHYGLGKVSDRVNKARAKVRQEAEHTAIAQVLNDEDVTAGDLIEAFELAETGPRQGQTVQYHDKNGVPQLAEVVEVTDSQTGATVVKLQDGRYATVNPDLTSQSPFSPDYIAFDKKISESTDKDLSKFEKQSQARVEAARKKDDVDVEAEANLKAVEVERKRRTGEKVEEAPVGDEAGAKTAEIERLQRINKRILKTAAEETKAKGGEKLRIDVKSQKALTENNNRIQELRNELGDIAPPQSAAEMTDQQIEAFIGRQSMPKDNLGAMGEFRDAADELVAEPTEQADLDPDAIEQENQLMLEELNTDDIQDLLPDDAKAELRELESIDTKAEKYEALVEAGRACVIRSKGT